MSVAQKGIDVRQTGTSLLFRASLKDSLGAKVTSGTTTLTLYEYQSDGTLKSYDFNDNTFKTTALTTATLALTHRTGNNATTNTGLWSVSLGTLTGFTLGAVYMVQITNSNAFPADQEREFQYGSAEGDLLVTATNYLKVDAEEVKNKTVPAGSPDGYFPADVQKIKAADFTALTGGAIADSVLGRNLAGGSDGGRTVQDALRAARNKVLFDVPAAGQLTVYMEDDVTPAWTATYTRGAAGLGPLTSTDPV